jgi:hypothetical protein
MSISLYFNEIKAITEKYSVTDFVVGSILHFDVRPGNQGYLKGDITFSDQSSLIFKEFLDYNKKINKVMYSYHYQNKVNALIFRYDNARHKPPLNSNGHKHLFDNTVIAAIEPDLQSVIDEIFSIQGWLYNL